MTIVLAALALASALVVPHLIRLEGVSPPVGAAIWLSALLLRAAGTVVAVTFLIIVVPASGAFHALTHWCWHTVLPLLATHLGLRGHSVAEAALVFPAVVVSFSAVSVGFGLAKGTRKVRRLLADGLGPGPSDSVIVRGGVVLVAAAGLRRPRVIVSAGALTHFDDAELYASLDHEHGHINRGHRWILVAGELARAVGRFVPGSRHALAELTFHLERDADRYAIARRHQPRDLASAICKAAQGGRLATATAPALGGSGVLRRVAELLEEAPRAGSAGAARVLAAIMVTLVVTVFAAVPPATMAAVHSSAQSPVASTCSG